MQHELELWGGMECTINRVQHVFFDQYARTGHLSRPGDLALFRLLGFRKLRYALHWERAAVAGSLDIFDAPLAEMQRLGIEPIAGLVHHGSGPAGTDLLDPEFPEKLAAYALEVATRYPWIESYTPVNEPQTTARFSGLYGHWYPHHRSYASYARALVHQLKASALAMRAIRTVSPKAQFVHTEDGGKTWSTQALHATCEEREQRRWLGMDLLCGRVDKAHPMLGYLIRHGIAAEEILWFSENPSPPDVLGFNYYVTSDRFLDHRLDMYPSGYRGGDTGEEALVDVEAVRVRREAIHGSEALLTEAWSRYGIPVAITEAHLGGTAEDQKRWLTEIWNGALAARSNGVDCPAVTVWALFGSFDWCSLVTRDEGIYEPGVFTLDDGKPKPTPLAELVETISAGKTLPKPDAGWWSRPERLTFQPPDGDE